MIEDFSRNLTEVVKWNKSIIIGDFNARVRNDRIRYGEVMRHLIKVNRRRDVLDTYIANEWFTCRQRLV